MIMTLYHVFYSFHLVILFGAYSVEDTTHTEDYSILHKLTQPLDSTSVTPASITLSIRP